LKDREREEIFAGNGATEGDTMLGGFLLILSVLAAKRIFLLIGYTSVLPL
jgi:hypothetical protein